MIDSYYSTMGLSCGVKCAKYILFAFNIVFWLSGIALIVVGAVFVSKTNFQNYQAFISPDDPILNKGGWVIIGAGIFVFLIGFCGCCGACVENCCLIGCYIAFLALVVCVEIGVGIFIGVKSKDVVNKFEQNALKLIQESYNTTSNYIKTAVDQVQSDWQCCGVNGVSDWQYSVFTNQTKLTAPDSCCNGTDTTQCQKNKIYFTKGCKDASVDFIKSKAPILIGVAVGIGLLELFGLIFAAVLCHAIRKDADYRV